MTPTLDQLPQHILSEILGPCVMRNNPDFQINVLETCSVRYIPYLPDLPLTLRSLVTDTVDFLSRCYPNLIPLAPHHIPPRLIFPSFLSST
jgi:hypothetical protein